MKIFLTLTKVIDEFGVTKSEVVERINTLESYSCNELKDIATELSLTDEEIRQLYQAFIDSINANGMRLTG